MMGARVLVSRAVRVARRTRQPSLRCVLVCCSASAGVLYVSRRGGMHQRKSVRRLSRLRVASVLRALAEQGLDLRTYLRLSVSRRTK